MNTLNTTAMNTTTNNTTGTTMNKSPLTAEVLALLNQQDVALDVQRLFESSAKAIQKEQSEAQRTILMRNAREANSVANTMALLKEVIAASKDGMDDQVAQQILHALITRTQFWDRVVETVGPNATMTPVIDSNTQRKEMYVMGQKTHMHYLLDTLKYFQAKTSSASARNIFEQQIELFKEVARLHTQYRVSSNEDLGLIKNDIVRQRLAQRLFLEQPQDTVVDLEVRYTGLLMSAVAGSVIKLQLKGHKDVEIKITKHSKYMLSASEIRAGILEAVNRVNIHIPTQDLNGKTTYTTRPVSVEGSILNKIFLVKYSNVDYSPLMEVGKEHHIKVMSVNKYGRLEAVAVPHSHGALRAAYMDTGIVSSSEAMAGYVSKMVNVPGLGFFAPGQDGKMNLVSNFDVNKFMARFKTMESNKGTAVPFSIRTQIVLSTHLVLGRDAEGNITITEMDEVTRRKAVQDWASGQLYVNGSIIRETLHGRVVSPMACGGLKANLAYSPLTEGKNMIGINGIKGDLISAAMLVWNEHCPDNQITVESFTVPGINQAAINFLFDNIETIDFNGYQVQVVTVDLKGLRITNPYTIDGLKEKGEDLYSLQEEAELEVEIEDLITNTNHKTSRLRGKLLDVIRTGNGTVTDVLMEGFENDAIVSKKLDTRLTASAHDFIALGHGKHASNMLMDELISNLDNDGKKEKRALTRILKGGRALEKNLLADMDAKDIAAMLINFCGNDLSDTVNTYPNEMFEPMMKLFNQPLNESNKGIKFIRISFDGNMVHVPAVPRLFYVHQDINSESSFLATGFLKDILTYVKGFLVVGNKKQPIHEASIFGEGWKLKARIQSRLGGKSFGYTPSKGGFFAALTPMGAYDANGYPTIAVEEVRTTNTAVMRDKKGNTVTEILRGKYPFYHELTFSKVVLTPMVFNPTADCEVTEEELAVIFHKAIFVHVEQMTSKGDDFDGDLVQLLQASQSVLDQFQWFRTSFKSEFYPQQIDSLLASKFEAISRGEWEATIKTETNFKHFSLDQMHDAITASTEASKNIGIFTTLKNRAEVIMASTKEFTALDGKTIKIDHDIRNALCLFLGYLCQVESMDNMKNNSQKATEAEKEANMLVLQLLGNGHIKKTQKLRRKETTEDAQARIAAFVNRVGTRINAMVEGTSLEQGTYQVSGLSFGNLVAEVMIYVSNTLEEKGVNYFNLFNERAVGDKFVDEIMETIHERPMDLGYDLTGKIRNIRKSSADNGSQAARLARKLMALDAPKKKATV